MTKKMSPTDLKLGDVIEHSKYGIGKVVDFHRLCDIPLVQYNRWDERIYKGSDWNRSGKYYPNSTFLNLLYPDWRDEYPWLLIEAYKMADEEPKNIYHFFIGDQIHHNKFGYGTVVDFHKHDGYPLVQFLTPNPILSGGFGENVSGKEFKNSHYLVEDTFGNTGYKWEKVMVEEQEIRRMGLKIGDRILHTDYGNGVVVDFDKYGTFPLVQFERKHEQLHNGMYMNLSGKDFNNSWYLFDNKEWRKLPVVTKEFEVGDRIEHEKYGIGTVVDHSTKNGWALVSFDVINNILHEGLDETTHGVKYPNSWYMVKNEGYKYKKINVDNGNYVVINNVPKKSLKTGDTVVLKPNFYKTEFWDRLLRPARKVIASIKDQRIVLTKITPSYYFIDGVYLDQGLVDSLFDFVPVVKYLTGKEEIRKFFKLDEKTESASVKTISRKAKIGDKILYPTMETLDGDKNDEKEVLTVTGVCTQHVHVAELDFWIFDGTYEVLVPDEFKYPQEIINRAKMDIYDLTYLCDNNVRFECDDSKVKCSFREFGETVTGESRCCSGDNFNIVIGQVIALYRAMDLIVPKMYYTGKIEDMPSEA